MSCPACDHTMTHIGETIDGPTRRSIWWCPRCGTLRVDGFGSFDETPKLVERCRDFYAEAPLSILGRADWKRIGIEEAIRKPEDRNP